MKKLILLFSLALLSACNKELIQPTNSPTAVFEAASKYIEETYSMFELKNLDWPGIHNKYKDQIQDDMSPDSLFAVCAAMTFELKDSHCYLTDNKGNRAAFDVTDGFYITPNLGSVLSYISEVQQWGNYLITGIINDIGYVNYVSFEKTEEAYWQQVMDYFKSKNVKKIIIDIRTNFGGDPLIAQNLCGYFIQTPTVLGAMYQKSGKGKNDFIGPLNLTTQPRQPYFGDIPVVLLTNRASYSASSYLAGMMKALPNVTQMGQITGGGGGGQLPFELPNGWVIGITANYFLDIRGRHIELGVIPDVSVVNTPADFEAGKDRMLEAAIAF